LCCTVVHHSIIMIVAVVYRQLNVSFSALRSDCSPPSCFVNRHIFTV